jgi:glutathione S-transferase
MRFRDLIKSLEITGRFICGEDMSIADFCIAALFIEVAEM